MGKDAAEKRRPTPVSDAIDVYRQLRRSASILTKFCLILIFSLLCLGQTAFAQSDEVKLKEAQERKRKNLENEEQVRRRAKELVGVVDRLRKQRAALNKKLREAGRDAQNIEAQMTEVEAELEQLSLRETEKRTELSKQNTTVSRLLAAMQRMGRNPPPVVVTHRSDALKMVRSAMLIGRAFPEFQSKAISLTTELNELIRLVTAQRQKKAELERKKSDYQETLARLAILKEDKQKRILSRSTELREVRKTADIISKNAAGLNELIEQLDRAVADKTSLGKYDSKIARAELEKPAGSGPPKNAAPPPTASRENQISGLSPSAVELVPRGSGLGANPGRLEPAIPFHRARARLPLPAQGKQIMQFGEQTSRGGRSKGMVIKTRADAQITSPCDGWVVYAGAFRSYGQLLIINAGGGYHVLLANLSRLDVQLGQFVLAAEPVGSMASSGRGRGSKSDPVLYIEFRKNGKPIDPRPWWAKGQKRMQG
ncbi:MAG: murein hydrolase activator EnvC family protein [Hyphomicrobiaceae bacterium]